MIDEDQKAIMECQTGKTESYRFLVDKYKNRAYYTALMFTGNRDDALDLSQEAFYRAFKAIKSFKPGKNFYTWFYRILKNISINHYKRIKKRNVVFSDAEESAGTRIYISPQAKPDEVFEEHELRDAVWNGLAQLKSEDREIIILKEFQELPYKEIAEVLDIPLGSVMSRLFYAKKKLAKILEGKL
jgi:RNA polymerase sigma-70 factor (ECF subfamily)